MKTSHIDWHRKNAESKRLVRKARERGKPPREIFLTTHRGDHARIAKE